MPNKRKRLDWQRKWKRRIRQRPDDIAVIQDRNERLKAILAMPIPEFKFYRYHKLHTDYLTEDDVAHMQVQHNLYAVIACFKNGLKCDYNYRFTTNKEYPAKRCMPVLRLMHHFLGVDICTDILAAYIGDPYDYDYPEIGTRIMM